jgi:phosphoribosylanthranilate isomerase
MTDIKICGLSTPDTMDAALDAGADYVGLVFFAKSPRNVDHATAAALTKRARGRAKVVALVVDASDSELDRIVAELAPDWLQLHGHESRDRVAAIKARYGLPVLKAMPVSAAADVEAARPMATTADLILFDAKPPKDATLPGGNGLQFDWRLLDAVDGAFPFMLSGGLTPENVATAIAATRATAVDVSSGVETAPGIKDADLIGRFLRAAKATTVRA